MAAAARKQAKVVETAGGVTVRHARIVTAIRAAGAEGEMLSTAEILRRAQRPGPKIVKPPTGPLRPSLEALLSPPASEGVATGGRGRRCVQPRVRGGDRREPGSDSHTPRQQDVFLTCGDPKLTLPCRCSFDRAHTVRSGAHFAPAAVKGPGKPGSGGVHVRHDSIARRYPPALLSGYGYSPDAVEDALFERQLGLAGIPGFPGAKSGDDRRTGVAVYDRYFGTREAQSVRASIRYFGLGLPSVGGGEK